VNPNDERHCPLYFAILERPNTGLAASGWRQNDLAEQPRKRLVFFLEVTLDDVASPAGRSVRLDSLPLGGRYFRKRNLGVSDGIHIDCEVQPGAGLELPEMFE